MAEKKARAPVVLLAGGFPCIVLLLVSLPMLAQRSLWLDEAWVANALDRGDFDPAGLNTTPLGFALAVRGVMAILGNAEWALRLVPCLCALAAVLLLFASARALYHGILLPALAATLLATNPVLLAYAQTLKPYTLDAAAGLAVLALAQRLSARSTPARWAWYAILLCALPLSSFGALYVAAALAPLLGRRAWRTGQVVPYLLTHGAAMVALAVSYLTYLRDQRSSTLLTFWHAGFPPGVRQAPGWLLAETAGFFDYLFANPGAWHAVILAGAMAVGAWCAGRRRQAAERLVLAAGPGSVALVALAACLHLYPYDGSQGGGRLLLFALPALLLLATRGLVALARVTGCAAPVVALVVLLAIADLGSLSTSLAQPEETRPLVRAILLPDLRPGDAIYVYYGAVYAFQYYAPAFLRPWAPVDQPQRFVRDRVTVYFGGMHRGNLAAYGVELRALRPSARTGRLWLLFSHIYRGEWPHTIAGMAGCGRPIASYATPGAALVLLACRA
jgi:hypothetical protein